MDYLWDEIPVSTRMANIFRLPDLGILEKDGWVTYFVGGRQLLFSSARGRTEPAFRLGQSDGERACASARSGGHAIGHCTPHPDALGGAIPKGRGRTLFFAPPSVPSRRS